MIAIPNCWYRCSVCGDHYPSIADNMKYNYCPNCGAKMEVNAKRQREGGEGVNADLED